MSYLDSINNRISIRTGDNVLYSSKEGQTGSVKYGLKVLQQSISQDQTYQLGEFNFINVPGRLLIQTVNLGRVFPLEIYFDGPDHLIISERFRISCNNKAPWTIEHPIYGIVKVKTSTLSFNNSAISYTKINGIVMETIADLPQGSGLLPLDQVAPLRDLYFEDAVLSFTETPTPGDITQLTNDNKVAFQNAVPTITLPEDFEKLNNAYNTAITYINIATQEPILMMRATMQVLLLPAQFNIEVKQRFTVLINTFNALRQTLFGIIGVSSKQLFQNKSGATIAALCEAAATPLPTDYRNAKDVLEVIGNIIACRNFYYQDMDTMQTTTGGTLQSFVANAQSITTLNNLVNTTVTGLYQIALSAKSQRSIVVEKDTNLIPLCHRLYGLDNNDVNLNDLWDQNSKGIYFEDKVLGLNEILIIPKGHEIVYYV